MRMMKVALVLLVLASFVAATAAVSMAATVTPTVKPTINATVKPTVTMMPVKKPAKMIDLSQMKANIGNVYKKLKTGTKMPGVGNNTTNKSGMGTASKMMNGIAKPSMSLSTPAMSALPAPKPLSQLGGLPQLGTTKAKIEKVPGSNLMIGLSL